MSQTKHRPIGIDPSVVASFIYGHLSGIAKLVMSLHGGEVAGN